jgi:hypothetical protein
LLAIALLASPGQLLFAQKVVEKTFPVNKDGKVNLNLKFGNTIQVLPGTKTKSILKQQ